MKDSSKILRVENLAGASISIGVIIFIDQILGLLYGSDGSVIMNDLISGSLLFYVIIHTFAGSLSGYLVERKTGNQTPQISILTSLLAYIFESLYYQLLIGRFEGIWSLCSLIIGGLMGFFFAKIRKERKTLQKAV
ncbi:hypothetical protein KEJ47_08610 [Candidatus Bathyarchaeota archaeon]|nr:hypothetical protein [Candidatus Bathyarchaeota archaeon]